MLREARSLFFVSLYVLQHFPFDIFSVLFLILSFSVFPNPVLRLLLSNYNFDYPR